MSLKITFIDADGKKTEVEAKLGDTLMQTAVNNSVPGIEADCGGNCACATCHVYVDGAWFNKIGEIAEMEQDMLEYAEAKASNSRLSCQIEIVEGLDGLIVTTPESQY